MDEEQRLTAITERARDLLRELPDDVLLVAAAKSRTANEVAAAAAGGVTAIGHNYVQEAEAMRGALDVQLSWHMIGHLQRNKARAAVTLFDMIETVDSWRLAREIDKRCAPNGAIMPVLLEVNSAREQAKAGVLPEDVEALAVRVAELAHVRVVGLMTMGPLTDDPEAIRPYFAATAALFERLRRREELAADLRHLSMGMSSSYRAAVEEGATMVRLGTTLFGPRPNGRT